MPFRVLFVCTGNICRSPAAEFLFRARIAPEADVHVSSAGTRGLVDHEVDGPTDLALRELGIDPSGHRARRLDTRMIAESDLVLTASSSHRSIVLQSEPVMMSRVFTLREFARLADAARDYAADGSGGAVTRDDLVARVALIARMRGTQGPAGPRENDIADPFGAPLSFARTVVAEIAAAVDSAIAGVNLSTSAGAQ